MSDESRVRDASVNRFDGCVDGKLACRKFVGRFYFDPGFDAGRVLDEVKKLIGPPDSGLIRGHYIIKLNAIAARVDFEVLDGIVGPDECDAPIIAKG